LYTGQRLCFIESAQIVSRSVGYEPFSGKSVDCVLSGITFLAVAFAWCVRPWALATVCQRHGQRQLTACRQDDRCVDEVIGKPAATPLTQRGRGNCGFWCGESPLEAASTAPTHKTIIPTQEAVVGVIFRQAMPTCQVATIVLWKRAVAAIIGAA